MIELTRQDAVFTKGYLFCHDHDDHDLLHQDHHDDEEEKDYEDFGADDNGDIG